MNRLFATLLFLASLTAGAAAQELPAPPANGLRDDTRALPEKMQAELARDIARSRAELGVDVWLNAGTFLPSGQTLRSQARDLRQFWSPSREAVLLAYDRASNSLAVSLSPGLWQRYSAAEIDALTPPATALISVKTEPLDQRLAASLRLVLAQIQTLEKKHRVASVTLPASHWRLARLFALGVTAGAVVFFLLGWLVRRWDIQAAWQLYFPSVQVGLRLGANHGGGVFAEKDTRQALP